ncbi:MAG: hypothetical protein Q4D57_04930 [Clostridia bacterium]|nr:hypothetical protein [Clostridia bacterium]
MPNTIETFNTKKLEAFSKTLEGAAVGSDTKKVVNAASEGNLTEYKKAIASYSWPFTRDYSMALLIFSPIVAAMQAVIKSKKQSDENPNDKTDDKEFENLVNKINDVLYTKILYSNKLDELCKCIGSGDGEAISENLNSFNEYKELLKMLSGNKYGNGGESDKFIKRTSKMTSWITNKKFIKNLLIPFVQGILGAKYASKITKGLSLKDTHDIDSVKIMPRVGEKQPMVSIHSTVRNEKGEKTGGAVMGIPAIKITESLRENCKKIGIALKQYELYIMEYYVINGIFKYINNKKTLTFESLDAIGNICRSCPNFDFDNPRPIVALLKKLLYVNCITSQTTGVNQKDVSVDKLDEIISNTNKQISEKAKKDCKKLYGNSFKI